MNTEQLAILRHTARNRQGLFCGGSTAMDELCGMGFMECVGTKSFVPDPYYRITSAGRKAATETMEKRK